MVDNFFSINDIILISNDHKYNFMSQSIYVKRDQKHINYVIGLDEKNQPCFDKIIFLDKPCVGLVVSNVNNHYYGRYYKIFSPLHQTYVFVRYEQMIKINSLFKIFIE